MFACLRAIPGEAAARQSVRAGMAATATGGNSSSSPDAFKSLCEAEHVIRSAAAVAAAAAGSSSSTERHWQAAVDAAEAQALHILEQQQQQREHATFNGDDAVAPTEGEATLLRDCLSTVLSWLAVAQLGARRGEHGRKARRRDRETELPSTEEERETVWRAGEDLLQGIRAASPDLLGLLLPASLPPPPPLSALLPQLSTSTAKAAAPPAPLSILQRVQRQQPVLLCEGDERDGGAPPLLKRQRDETLMTVTTELKSEVRSSTRGSSPPPQQQQKQQQGKHSSSSFNFAVRVGRSPPPPPQQQQQQTSAETEGSATAAATTPEADKSLWQPTHVSAVPPSTSVPVQQQQQQGFLDTHKAFKQTTLSFLKDTLPASLPFVQQPQPPPPPQQQQQQQQPPPLFASTRSAREEGEEAAAPLVARWRTSTYGRMPQQQQQPPPPQPSRPTRAPPYQYQCERGIGNQSAEQGFVTAGEQLLSDIKAGRSTAINSSLLSTRSPALGLRRGGFQPPFQQQQQQQQEDGSTSASVHKVLSSIVSKNKTAGNGGANGGQGTSSGGGGGGSSACKSNNDDDDDAGEFPASLLLPDGSVPEVLRPLDPKLVSQVAAEILENGAGARQIGWEDIAGLQHAKVSVEEAVVWPLQRPDLFVGLRDPPRGLLLFGPPGTGKTMIARAIANRAQCTFLNISSSSIMSKWMGDGEKLVRCLFAVATVKQPSVIFIDEIDSLLSARGEGEMDSVRRVKTEFLVQLDGVATDRGDRVLLIGATNRPDELDEAARRRMEKRLYIPLPDEEARKELIVRLLYTLERDVANSALGTRTSTGQRTGEGENGVTEEDHNRKEEEEGSSHPPSTRARAVHTLTDEALTHLAKCTAGYSGADLKNLCREAAMGPLREMTISQFEAIRATELRPVEARDFKQALKRLKPSVGAAEVTRYEEWNKLFGSFADEGDPADEDDEGSNSLGVL